MVSMNLLTIDPFHSVGRLQLGSTRSQVRAGMAGKPVEILHPFAAQPVDHFKNSLIQVSYDESGLVEHIEVSSPLQVLLDGRKLLGRPTSEVLDELRDEGLKAYLDKDDPMGYYFLDIGIAITSDEESLVTTSIGVFRRDVYHLKDGNPWQSIDR